MAVTHRRAHKLTGDSASPRAVRSRWGSARIIHVASHGMLHADDPRSSGIMLSGGAWTLYDLHDTPTRADLVVLGSCQSGEEILWGGDDGVGFVPTLFQTGARAAIVSLWSVDDAATHATMTRLHRHLVEGCSAGDAIGRCWGELREISGSPYHWAPFVLYGADTSPGVGSWNVAS